MNWNSKRKPFLVYHFLLRPPEPFGKYEGGYILKSMDIADGDTQVNPYALRFEFLADLLSCTSLTHGTLTSEGGGLDCGCLLILGEDSRELAQTLLTPPPPPLTSSHIKPNFHTFSVMCMKGFSYLPQFNTFSV